MTVYGDRNHCFGFSAWDVLVILAIVFIGGALLLPQMTRSKPRGNRIYCVSNLKQVGLAFRMWSNDHQEFPFQVSVTNGGSLEFAESGEVFRHFLAASNELVSPKILACPTDRDTRRTNMWTNFSNTNVSYFVGLNARENLPAAILAGDRNITGGVVRGSIMIFSNHATAGFTSIMHSNQGNLVFADGSASQATTHMLRKAVETGVLPARFAIPRVSEHRVLVSWQTGLQTIALWALIAISGVAAIFFYIMATRRIEMRAASG